MKVICRVCNGKGKVKEDFGMGKCKEIPNDPFNRICPACDGTGMQDDNERTHPEIWPCKPIRHQKPYNPYKPFPEPPFPFGPKRKKGSPVWFSV